MKDCKNCDHKIVCGHIGEVCSHWIGWVDCDDEKPDGMVALEVYGSDVIRCEKGESLEEALERISKIHYTMHGYYDEDDEVWCGDIGFPLNPQPKFWHEMPMFTEAKGEEE